MTLPVIEPDWPAPPRVRVAVSTRAGGVSAAPYDSLNLGEHVGDSPEAVTENRRRLAEALALPVAPRWMTQVHGARVLDLDAGPVGGAPAEADAAVTATVGRVCAVLTADCLPVVLCDRDGSAVAVAHAGWRGLAGGVLEATVAAMPVPGQPLLAWLGPAISAARFEVGDEVREAFVAHDPAAAAAFARNARGRWQADLYALARQRLAGVGVTRVFGGGYCTHEGREAFFSHRRDGCSGRFATLAWLAP